MLDAHGGLAHVHVRLIAARWLLQRIHTRLVDQRDRLRLQVRANELAHVGHADISRVLRAIAVRAIAVHAIAIRAGINVPCMLELRECCRLSRERPLCVGRGPMSGHVLQRVQPTSAALTPCGRLRQLC